MATVIDTDTIGGDGQVVHPALGNESEDGSGTWHVLVTDSDGYLMVTAV